MVGLTAFLYYSASSLPGTFTLGVRRTPNQTDSDVTCSRSRDQGKITKRMERKSELRKTRFSKKKNNPPVFLNRIFVFFFKETSFCFLKKKTQKYHSELFLLNHAISQFSELHNNNLLYLLCHSNLRVKKCTLSLFSLSAVGQLTPKWQGLPRTRKVNRENPIPHKLCSFT